MYFKIRPLRSISFSNNNNNNLIMIIMGLESVSASEDVIGTSLRPRLPSIHNNCGNPGRRGKKKVGTLAGSVIPSICPDYKKDYGGKRCVFNEERNKGKVRQDRSGRGSEFQMDRAANAKERRPFADRISGTVRRNLSRDLKFLVGI